MDKRQATEFLGYLLRDKNIERTIYEDALKIAIESLKAQLSKEGTTSDLISRTATIDAVNNAFDRETLLTGFVRSIAVRAIRDMPSVQPEPQEGEWVQIQRCARDAQPDLECPFCKHRIGWFDMGRYCAKCGAKLKGGAG